MQHPKNRWHNVQGVSEEEMSKSTAKVEKLYGDLMYQEYTGSKRAKKLSSWQRAAQFSPFAALTGYDAAIEETGRLTDQRIELTESSRQQLDENLALLTERLKALEHLSKEERKNRSDIYPRVQLTQFVADMRKAGGSYESVNGAVRSLDPYSKVLILTDDRRIPLDDVYEIEILS